MRHYIPTVDQWPGLVIPFIRGFLVEARDVVVGISLQQWTWISLTVVLIGFLCMRGLHSNK